MSRARWSQRAMHCELRTLLGWCEEMNMVTDARAMVGRMLLRIPRLVTDRLLRPRSAGRFAAAPASLLCRLREPMADSITLDADVMARVVASSRGGIAPLTQSETHELVATGEHI